MKPTITPRLALIFWEQRAILHEKHRLELGATAKQYQKIGWSVYQLLDEPSLMAIGINIYDYTNEEQEKLAKELVLQAPVNELQRLHVGVCLHLAEFYARDEIETLPEFEVKVPRASKKFNWLKEITQAFSSTDELKPGMQGVFVGKHKELVATNAHILICVPASVTKVEQALEPETIYNTRRMLGMKEKIYHEDAYKYLDKNGLPVIDYRFPDFENVFGSLVDAHRITVDISTLYTWAARNAELGKYLWFNDRVFGNEGMGSLSIPNTDTAVSFRIHYLLKVLTFLLKAGADTMVLYIEDANKAITFTAFVPGTTEGIAGLIMPVMRNVKY